MNFKIRHYIDLITVLTHKEMKVRYKSTFLGYVWSIAHPLAFAFVFFMAFKVVMRIQMEGYAVFLIAGLFPWQWFSNSINASPTIFLHNSSLIKKVNLPRNALPLATVLQDSIHFLLAIPVIVLFLFIYHKSPSFSWLYGIPLLLCIQLLMTYGLCLMIASINLFVRDLERLAGIGINLLFYFTPIIYPETMIPARYKTLVLFVNPLSSLMVSWRNLFLDGSLPVLLVFVSFIYSLFILIVGYAIYTKLSWKFAEVL
ncbi:ABC transporter permease [Microgenomates group bacterium RBG_16_45_19]|nr:MAG: ABC transporter permease [Microgenomates group bacterium RBG_16_45_19]